MWSSCSNVVHPSVNNPLIKLITRQAGFVQRISLACQFPHNMGKGISFRSLREIEVTPIHALTLTVATLRGW